MPEYSNEYLAKLQELSEEYDNLCADQWEKGAEEYGPYKFLEKSTDDLFKMAFEELADTSNYARSQFVKLRLLQEALSGGSDHSAGETHGAGEDKLPSGARSFIPGAKLHRLLPED